VKKTGRKKGGKRRDHFAIPGGDVDEPAEKGQPRVKADMKPDPGYQEIRGKRGRFAGENIVMWQTAKCKKRVGHCSGGIYGRSKKKTFSQALPGGTPGQQPGMTST